MDQEVCSDVNGSSRHKLHHVVLMEFSGSQLEASMQFHASQEQRHLLPMLSAEGSGGKELVFCWMVHSEHSLGPLLLRKCSRQIEPSILTLIHHVFRLCTHGFAPSMTDFVMFCCQWECRIDRPHTCWQPPGDPNCCSFHDLLFSLWWAPHVILSLLLWLRLVVEMNYLIIATGEPLFRQVWRCSCIDSTTDCCCHTVHHFWCSW